MERHGSLIRLKDEALEEYKRIHKAVWPGVLATIKACNISNYSIFYKDGVLYAYFEYTGTNLKADMAKMAADPTTQAWWKITMPMQDPLPTRKEGEWWAEMEEMFHID